MDTRKKLFTLAGIALAAALILSACNTAATVAPTPISAATLLPVLPVETATPVPTETPIPTETSTPTATATATATPVAQVVPSVNAYCRSGPGSNYNPITTLVSGTAYNVVGRNSLNDWWLVELWGGAITCWTGAQGTSLVGPVDQAPVVLAQVVLPKPAMFMYSYTCRSTSEGDTFNVTLTWNSVDGATGYSISRNGVPLAEVGATGGVYIDYDAPMHVNLVYQLEARNAGGSTGPQYVMVPACGL